MNLNLNNCSFHTKVLIRSHTHTHEHKKIIACRIPENQFVNNIWMLIIEASTNNVSFATNLNLQVARIGI